MPVSRFVSYLKHASALLGGYDHSVPFPVFAKSYFKNHKKAGSTDRKIILQCCYSYFRTAHLFPDEPVEEKILKAVFLWSREPAEMIQQHRPSWLQDTALPAEEKLKKIAAGKEPSDIFPWSARLSKGINPDAFALSFLHQPDLFIRIRPGYQQLVQNKLASAGISFTLHSDTCVSIPNATKLDSHIRLNQEAVVQDFSSQRIGELMKKIPVTGMPVVPAVWDCCAASGGKSILAKDVLGEMQLTVSDIRDSILKNLAKRFAEAGIHQYKSVTADVASSTKTVTEKFNLILADVPCTGSGTWSRNPEHFHFFRENDIAKFVSLQRRIVINVIPHLQNGGFLLYSTCSVFSGENEEMVSFIRQQFALDLLHMELIEGYSIKADTMFAALFRMKL